MSNNALVFTPQIISSIGLATIQLLAVLTFVGFLGFVFFPKLRRGSTVKELFVSTSGSRKSTAIFLCLYLFLFIQLFAFTQSPSSLSIFFTGFFLALSGLLVAFVGRMQLRRVWSPVTKTEPSTVLVDHGIFSLIRHPIYLGRLSFFAGVMLMLNLYGLILLPFYWFLLHRKASDEEAILARSLHGYDAYRRKVKRGF